MARKLSAYEYYMKMQGKLNKNEEQQIFNSNKLNQLSINTAGADNNEGAVIQTLIDDAPTNDTKIDAGFNNDLYYTKEGLQVGGLDHYVDDNSDSFNILDRKDDISFNQANLYDTALKNGSFLNQRETQLNLQTQLNDLKQQLTLDDPTIDKNIIQTKIDALNKELEDPSLSHMANIYGNVNTQIEQNLKMQQGLYTYNQQQNQANLQQGESQVYKGYMPETYHAFKSGGLSLISKILAVPLDLVADRKDNNILGHTLTKLDDYSRNSNFYEGYNDKDVQFASKMATDSWKDITEGHYLNGAFKFIKAAYALPQVIAQSLPEMSVIVGSNIATGGAVSGLALATAITGAAYGAENIRIAEDNNHGKPLSSEHKAGILAGSFLNALIQNGAGELVFGHGINKLIFKNKITGKDIISYDALKKKFPEEAGHSLWYAITDSVGTASKAGLVEVPAEMLDPIISNIVQKYNTEEGKNKLGQYKSMTDLAEDVKDQAIASGILGFYAGKAINLTVEGTPKITAIVSNMVADKLYRDPDFRTNIKQYLQANNLTNREDITKHLIEQEKHIKSQEETLYKLKIDNLKEIDNPQTAGEHLQNIIYKIVNTKLNNNILSNITFRSNINSELKPQDILNNLKDPAGNDIDILFNALISDNYAKSKGFNSAIDMLNHYEQSNDTALPTELKRQILNDSINDFKSSEIIEKLKQVKDYLDKTPEDIKPSLNHKIEAINTILNNLHTEVNNIINKNPLLKTKTEELKRNIFNEELAKHKQGLYEHSKLIAQATQAFNNVNYTEKMLNEIVKPVYDEAGKIINGNTEDSLIHQTLNKIKEGVINNDTINSLVNILKNFSNVRDNYTDTFSKNPKEAKLIKQQLNEVKKDTLESVGKVLKEKKITPENLREKFENKELDKETLDLLLNLSNVLDENGKLSDEDIDILGSSLGLDDISSEDIKMLISFIKLLRQVFNVSGSNTNFNYDTDYKKKDTTQIFKSAFTNGSEQEKRSIVDNDISYVLGTGSKYKLNPAANIKHITSKSEQFKEYVNHYIKDSALKTKLLKLLDNPSYDNLVKVVKILKQIIDKQEMPKKDINTTELEYKNNTSKKTKSDKDNIVKFKKLNNKIIISLFNKDIELKIENNHIDFTGLDGKLNYFTPRLIEEFPQHGIGTGVGFRIFKNSDFNVTLLTPSEKMLSQVNSGSRLLSINKDNNIIQIMTYNANANKNKYFEIKTFTYEINPENGQYILTDVKNNKNKYTLALGTKDANTILNSNNINQFKTYEDFLLNINNNTKSQESIKTNNSTKDEILEDEDYIDDDMPTIDPDRFLNRDKEEVTNIETIEPEEEINELQSLNELLQQELNNIDDIDINTNEVYKYNENSLNKIDKDINVLKNQRNIIKKTLFDVINPNLKKFQFIDNNYLKDIEIFTKLNNIKTKYSDKLNKVLKTNYNFSNMSINDIINKIDELKEINKC